ncbi:hypothetical protein VNO78_02571 [Psophocarpus tetragonolobus]|uniref:Uncharacterized protein n=1 Tax=Psophocarpus tetragonolobus TaxID=3891 RepID=A0AAN9SZJ3_PSOTE
MTESVDVGHKGYTTPKSRHTLLVFYKIHSLQSFFVFSSSLLLSYVLLRVLRALLVLVAFEVEQLEEEIRLFEVRKTNAKRDLGAKVKTLEEEVDRLKVEIGRALLRVSYASIIICRSTRPYKGPLMPLSSFVDRQDPTKRLLRLDHRL